MESNDPLVDEQEAAAAQEGGRIGGTTPEYASSEEQAVADDAERPLAEAGEGEAEGFEQAEAELRDQAENFDEHRSPERDAMTEEAESDESGAEYAEADQVEASEVVEPDDAGPTAA